MPELYKGQYENFKKTSEEILNDPLAAIKESLRDEEEKFNTMDENHAPILFFSVDVDPDRFNFCNIYGGITLRKSDGKMARFFRYMYSDGTKNWTVLKNKETGSVWAEPETTMEEEKKKFLQVFQKASEKIGFGMGAPRGLSFTGKEKLEAIMKKLQESDLVYMAKIDPKKKTIKYINGEEK